MLCPNAFLDLLSERVGVGRSGKVREVIETVVDDAKRLRRLRTTPLPLQTLPI